MAHGGFREVRSQMLGDVQDAWLAHSIMSYVKRSTKISIFDPKSKHLRGFQSQNTVISWSFCILWTRCENGNRS